MLTRNSSSHPEVVDGVPVTAPRAQLSPVRREAAVGRPVVVPARQAAALTATGFLAGAAAAAVVSRRASRWSLRRRRRKGILGEIVSSNSFLVDVHLVRRG